MTEVTSTKKKRSKALPITFLVLGVLLIVGALIVFYTLQTASAETVGLIADEIRDTGGSTHLTEYKLQFAAMGFAAATGIAGVAVLIGAVVQLFRK